MSEGKAVEGKAAATIRRVSLANLAKKAQQGETLTPHDWRMLERHLAETTGTALAWMHSSNESLAEAIGRTARQVQNWRNDGCPQHANGAWNEIAVRVWCYHRGIADLKPSPHPDVRIVLELVERTVTERAAGAGTGDITVATVPKTWREESSKQEALKRVRERELLDLQLAKARGEVVARVDAEALAAAVVARARRALQSTHAAMLAKVPEKWRTKLGPIMDEAVEEWAKALAEGDP